MLTDNFIEDKEHALDVAIFLLSNSEFVDKDALGRFFGSPEDMSQVVLREFVAQIPLGKLDVDDALRLLLFYFSLPGESQQIDRIITVFSEEYVNQNPDMLCNDSVYLLAYSLMMLQTDAHNKNVVNKMDLKSFLSMTNAIKVRGKDPLQTDYITALYRSVIENPLSVHHSVKNQVQQYTRII